MPSNDASNSSDADLASVEAHIRACPECDEALEAFVEAAKLYEQMEDLVIQWPDHCTIVSCCVRKDDIIASILVSEPSMSGGRLEVPVRLFTSAGMPPSGFASSQ